MKSTSTFFWLLAIGLVLSSATQAQITVTSTADSGPGSLRQAIVNASSGNTINITVTGTIVLTTGQLIIDKDLTITGPGASQLTISGNNVTRVFFINPGAAGATTGPPSGNLVVTIKELTIANGRASGGDGGNGGGAGGGAAGMGGGLFINRGTVAVDHVSFTGNQAVGGTGGRGGYGTSGSGGGGGGFGGNGNRTEIGGEGGALGGSGGTYVFGANGGSGGDGAGGGGGGCCSGELGGSGGFGGGGGGGASFGTSTGGSGGFGGGGGGGGGTNSGGGIGAAGGTFGGTGGSQVGTYNDGGGGGGGGLGGAIFIRAGSITVTQSSFTGNQATPGVGGLAKNGTASGTAGQGKGGAIFILDAGATASISDNTTYSNNTATDAGGVTTDNANTYGTFSTCAAFTATLTPSGQLTCANSTVTLTAGGGLAGATYQYSLGATNNGSTATVIADGPYSVTVTNPGGCSSTATTTVTSNTAVPTVSITPSTTAICAGQTATFTASGSPASYSWSSGQTTANISATAQGPYSVTATNTDNGCQTSATANLTVNPLPTPAITNLNEAYCKDATPVTLIGSPTGGAFTIDGTTATTFNPASLSVGQHTVVYSYTNATGCSAATSRSITVNSIPSPTLVASGGLTCSQTSVTLTTSGGTSYTFTSPGGTVLAGSGNTRTVSSPGTYSVTAANASGCVSSTSTSVLSNTAVITVSNPTTSTATLNTPFSQSFTASGGASPYSYSLASGSLPAGLSLSTTGVLSGTPSQGGSFTLVVRGQDANGCFDLGPTYILQVNATPTITGFGAVDNTVCVGSPISFTATVGNVTGAYAFTLSIGTNSLSGTATGAAFSRSLTASGSGTQSFTLTVGDNGFQATAQTTVTVNALPPATLVGSGTLTCGNTSVTLTASPAGQPSYAFSAGATQISTSNQATVSQAGTYSVTVTNAGGCSAVAQVTVTGSTTAPSVAVNRPTNPSSCSGSNGSISFTTNLADGPYSLTYTGSGSPGTVTVSSGAFSLTGLSAGSYSNFSISNNGCVGTAAGPVSLTAPTAPTATLDNNGPLTCATTSVTLTASLGGAGYMFSPNANQIGGSPGNTATVDRPGMYTVVVTSANGCSASATTTVMSNTTAPDAPLIATQSGHSYPGGVSTLTVAQNTGAVVLMVSGCSGGTITWSGGTSSTLSVATQTTGTQTFTATCTSTSNGCPSQLATATITVIAPTLTVLSRDPDNGQLNTNTLKPYLQLNNQSTTPIAYSEITIRYWLTVENPAPLIYQINYAQMGNDKVHLTYVPISPLRQGATGYIEFSFDASAGSLAGNTSAVIQDLINKQDYSMFFQGDDYSYVNNPNFAPNPHITAYQNGVLIYGTKPGQAGPPPVLMLTASANPATILTTGSTQLQANVSGGTPGYTYSFSGPGTIAPNGNTASVSGLMAGVQTFTVTVTDVTTPVNQTIATTVSVTVTAPPANTPPMPTANPNQTATVGVLFSYAVNAFGDNETPNSLTYTASINPANGFTFNPATRVVQGSPQNTGVSSVTITATDPGGLSASTIFTITVSPAPVAPTALSLSLSASPTTILTTGTTTLSATVSGGTLPYGYAFAGPGTITPSGNTATVSNLPAGVQTFTVVVRDASSPSSQSISTTVSVTVNAPSPSATQLTVLSRDPENGNLNTNTIRPYLLLQNDGSTPIPYGELTVRYYLTLENPAPLRFDVNYAQMGNDKVYFTYVPLSPARQGATGYIEFSFDASAGSLAPMSNAVIQDLINKQDYSYFNQGDDYSYVNNANFAPNAHITAYRNGVLIYGTEPPTGARLSAENADAPLTVRVLGNPLSGGEMMVEVQGAAGQSLRLRVTDLAGHLVSEQAVERAGAQERQRLGVGRASAGLLFLQVSTPTQSQTVKVLKVD